MYIIMWNHNICFHGHSPTPKKSTPRSGALRPTAHCAGELAVLRVEGRTSGGVWGGVLMDWFKGKFTGKPHDLHGKIYGFL